MKAKRLCIAVLLLGIVVLVVSRFYSRRGNRDTDNSDKIVPGPTAAHPGPGKQTDEEQANMGPVVRNTFLTRASRGATNTKLSDDGTVLHMGGHYADRKTMLRSLVVPYDTPQIEIQLRERGPGGEILPWSGTHFELEGSGFIGPNQGDNDADGLIDIRTFEKDPNTGDILPSHRRIPMVNMRFAAMPKNYLEGSPPDYLKIATDIVYLGEKYTIRLRNDKQEVVAATTIEVPDYIARGEVAVFRIFADEGKVVKPVEKRITGQINEPFAEILKVTYYEPSGESHWRTVLKDGTFSISYNKLGGKLAVSDDNRNDLFLMGVSKVSKTSYHLPSDADIVHKPKGFVKIRAGLPSQWMSYVPTGGSKNYVFYLGPVVESGKENWDLFHYPHHDSVFPSEWQQFKVTPVLKFCYTPGDYGIYFKPFSSTKPPILIGHVEIPINPPDDAIPVKLVSY